MFWDVNVDSIIDFGYLEMHITKCQNLNVRWFHLFYDPPTEDYIGVCF